MHTHRGDSGQHPWPLTHQMPGAQPLQVVKSQMPSDLAQRAPGGNNHPGPGPGRSLAALQRTRPCGKILPCPWNPRFVPRHRRGQAHAGIDTHSHTEVTLCFSRPAWAHTQMSFRGGTGAMEGGRQGPKPESRGSRPHTSHPASPHPAPGKSRVSLGKHLGPYAGSCRGRPARGDPTDDGVF